MWVAGTLLRVRIGVAAIVSKSAIERALAGGPTVDRASSVTMVQRLDPDPYDNFWFQFELGYQRTVPKDYSV